MANKRRIKNIRKNIIDVVQDFYPKRPVKQALLFFSLQKELNSKLSNPNENLENYTKVIIKDVAQRKSQYLNSTNLLHLL